MISCCAGGIRRLVMAGLAVLVLVIPARGQDAGGDVILNERCALRQYYRFAPNRVSPALLKSDGTKILGKALFDRLQRDTERRLGGQAKAGSDWRDQVVMAEQGARANNPNLAPAPPADWADVDFDDSAWVRLRQPFQGAPAPTITKPILGQLDETVDLKLVQSFYRGRFVVADPAAAAVTLKLVYAGGARVLLNGQEIARGHLPAGQLAEDACADDYPASAYGKGAAARSHRTLGPVKLPADKLNAGVNVLAVEIRGSAFHPVVLTNPIVPNWGTIGRPWPHCRLVSIELCGTGSESATRRPAGVQVWAEDMHHRTLSSDFLPPGEAAGKLRLVAGRNGICSGQIVVGTDKPLADVQVRCTDLKSEAQSADAGQARPLNMQVVPMVGFPCSKWCMKVLGDERGLDASLPTMKELSTLGQTVPPGDDLMFDRILSTSAAVTIQGGSARPFWLRVSIPKDAAPGVYSGKVEAAAGQASLGSLEVELEVTAAVLPSPADFQTLVGCEQNPYAVARQHGVKPWSEKHWKMIESSLIQLDRVGDDWLNVPILANTEMGNGQDSPVRWVRTAAGWEFEFAVLDRYLDTAIKCGIRPRVIQFIVMHGMKPVVPSDQPQVAVLNKATGRATLMAVGDSAGAEATGAWKAFGSALLAHMKQRKLDNVMYWGAPWEGEAQPELKKTLAQAAPGVYWTAGPHEMMYNGKYAKDTNYYHLVADIRYQGGWPNFRDDMGWKSKTLHPVNPRVGGTVYAMHTTSYPFAYRLMVDRALAKGNSGFARIGADGWAGTHYSGMTLPQWTTGIPVLFVLWPGEAGADSSARFEVLIEGVQEAELRILIEQAMDSGKLSPALASEVGRTLAQHFAETNVCQGNSISHSIEQYHWKWQERSRRLLTLAAKVQAASKP